MSRIKPGLRPITQATRADWISDCYDLLANMSLASLPLDMKQSVMY